MRHLSLVLGALGAARAPLPPGGFDESRLAAIRASSSPALLRLDPGSACVSCAAIDPLWDELVDANAGVVWRVNCQESREQLLC